MHRALKWWIQTLYEANIDLMDYGVKEQAVWDKIDVARECIYNISRSRFWRRFIGFSYYDGNSIECQTILSESNHSWSNCSADLLH